VVSDTLTVVVVTLYMLADQERIRGFAFALLPRGYHVRAARILLDRGVIVGGYMRGQALTSLAMGVVVFAVLAATGTPNALGEASGSGAVTRAARIGQVELWPVIEHLGGSARAFTDWREAHEQRTTGAGRGG